MLTKVLLLPLMAYAAVGLALSLAAHLLAYADIQLGGTGLFFALHAGIFPLWFAAILMAGRMTGGVKWNVRWGGARRRAGTGDNRRSREVWNAIMAECP